MRFTSNMKLSHSYQKNPLFKKLIMYVLKDIKYIKELDFQYIFRNNEMNEVIESAIS